MAKIRVIPLDHADLPPREISPRLRSQLVYFMSPPGSPGVPVLGPDEYWFDADDVARWCDEGVFSLVSPLDTENAAVVELSEDQEDFLAWLHERNIRHVRVEG